jgi:cell division protease FtsH
MGQEYSDGTAEKIDAEIRRVVDEAYKVASRLLTEHREELDKLSLLLVEKETIDREEFEALLAGDDPDEVFKARDEAKARKTAESKRVQRQRRPREDGEPGTEGLGQVAPGGVSPMTSYDSERVHRPW